MISAEEIKALMAKDAYRTKGEWTFEKILDRTSFGATYSLKAGDVLLSDDECYYPTGLDIEDAEFVAVLANKAIPAIHTLQALLNQAAEVLSTRAEYCNAGKPLNDVAEFLAAIEPYRVKEGE